VKKRQFTVLGEAVNLAARYEAMCKDYCIDRRERIGSGAVA
jgi:class 3 adenylate cyclase